MRSGGSDSKVSSTGGDGKVRSTSRRQALEEELDTLRQELEFVQQGSALKERKLSKEIKELRELNHKLNSENDELAHDVQDLLRDNEEMYHELVASASHLKNLAKLNQEMEAERDQLAEAFLELQEGSGKNFDNQSAKRIDEAEVERRIELALQRSESQWKAENTKLKSDLTASQKAREDLARQVDRLKMLLELQKDSDEEGNTNMNNKKKIAKDISHNKNFQSKNQHSSSLTKDVEAHGHNHNGNNNQIASSSGDNHGASYWHSDGHGSYEGSGKPYSHDSGGGSSGHRSKIKGSGSSSNKSGRKLLNFSSTFGDWVGSSAEMNEGRSRKEKTARSTSERKASSKKVSSSRHLSSRQQQNTFANDHIPTLEDPNKYPSLNGLVGQSKKEKRRN